MNQLVCDSDKQGKQPVIFLVRCSIQLYRSGARIKYSYYTVRDRVASEMANFFSNLYNKVFGKSAMQILIFGLNGGVGKTTVLYRIKDGATIDTFHTVGFNLETVEHNNASYELWDIGGGDKITALWSQYFHKPRGVIFVIDSTDKERLNTVEDELSRLLNEKELENCPFLLLANKQDLPEAVSVDDLKKELKLDQWKDRNIHILSAVANQGTGVSEGFEWLCSEIAKAPK